MSIFGKKPPSPPESRTPAADPPSPAPRPSPRSKTTQEAHNRSFLGPGCKVEGDLRGEASLEFQGSFEGTVDIDGDFTIRPGGVAKALIKARAITIEGRLEGDATGAVKVEVGASGHVQGDVRAPAVKFAEGAFFEGNVEMRREKTAGASEADTAAGNAPNDEPLDASA